MLCATHTVCVTPRNKRRELKCHQMCRDLFIYLFIAIKAPILPTLLCSQPGPGGHRELTLYLLVGALLEGNSLV